MSRCRSRLFIYCNAYRQIFLFFFFFNDTATTEIYTLSLHDALPIYKTGMFWGSRSALVPIHPPYLNSCLPFFTLVQGISKLCEVTTPFISHFLPFNIVNFYEGRKVQHKMIYKHTSPGPGLTFLQWSLRSILHIFSNSGSIWIVSSRAKNSTRSCFLHLGEIRWVSASSNVSFLTMSARQ